MRISTAPAGNLDKRVTLQAPTRTDVGGGVTDTSWQDVATVWAQIVPKKGKEYRQGQQVQSAVTHEVTLRKPVKRADGTNVRPTPAMRLVHEGRILEMMSVLDLEGQGFNWLIEVKEKIKREAA